MDAIFRSVFDAFNSVVNNYGIAVILFTVFIRLVQMPFDYKSRKAMRKMEKVNPQIQALQKKYANDKEKLQKKQAELYKKEKISPLSGCWPMLITLPIMFILFGVLRNVANEQLVINLLKIQSAVGDLTVDDKDAIIANLPSWDTLVHQFLWIKNLWMPDSPFSPILPAVSSALTAVGNSIEGVITAGEMDALKLFVDGDVYQKIIRPYYELTTIPGASLNLLIVNWQVYVRPNGFLILPILSFITQFMSNKYLTQQSTAQANQQGTGMMTKWMMPIIFAFFCVSYTASFALYIVVSSVLHVIQTRLFTLYFDAQDKKAAAQTEEVDRL